MDKIVKIAEFTTEGIGSNKVPKDILENLRGKIVILNPEESEIAKKLEIEERGTFGVRFR
jgi:RNA polymerase subunit RPABC4/transcription elongation factor Spt4